MKGFTVIDNKTGNYPDCEEIALNDDWAKHLCYCDVDTFAITEDGLLILIDDCGKCAFCPEGRFTVVTDNNVGDKLAPTEPLTNCQHWIPVTERLPELHGDFITAIAFEDGDILIDISVWFGKCWESLSGEPMNVTHWMPLPEPPKEVE